MKKKRLIRDFDYFGCFIIKSPWNSCFHRETVNSLLTEPDHATEVAWIEVIRIHPSSLSRSD